MNDVEPANLGKSNRDHHEVSFEGCQATDSFPALPGWRSWTDDQGDHVVDYVHVSVRR